VVPQRSPLDGVEVTIYTDGSALLGYSNCLCRFGALVVPASCVAQLQVVRCQAPRQVRATAMTLDFFC